ncbi:MAG TPA: hypothetical protein PLE74_07945 [Candidatus Cloacimonadota bacterium]|nr:hypothetical protein [Candidatus Cloacimonadota bacterium]
MNAVNFVFTLNPADQPNIKNSKIVDLYTKQFYNFTFWNTPFSKYNSLPFFFSDEAIDLFYISMFVTYADRLVQRKEFEDSWTRKFHLYIPVLCLDKWLKEKNIIEEMLSFLSGDRWSIDFRKRELNERELKFKKIFTKAKQSKLQLVRYVFFLVD